ncbi:MAG: dTDP-4-dehydrorhamnose reductase [Candidatus Acidiferrales bacterium]
MKPKILLTGRNGQIGAELKRLLADSSDLLALARQDLDLCDSENIRRTIRDFRPHLIINAAAYTGVDQAESDESAARAINAEAPVVIAEEAKQIGAGLIHYSTDYVFDGSKASPYSEDDPANPINVYGKTKLAGERGIQNVDGSYLIFRTAWVYGTRGKNFMLTILRLATTREELRVVADQIGAPTWSREIARATTTIITQEWQSCGGAFPFSKCRGIYHMTAGGQSNWWEFASNIVEQAQHAAHDNAWLTAATGGRPLVVKRISPVATTEYPTPARRPAYSILSNSRLTNVFGVQLSDWRPALRTALQSE